MHEPRIQKMDNTRRNEIDMCKSTSNQGMEIKNEDCGNKKDTFTATNDEKERTLVKLKQKIQQTEERTEKNKT